MIGRMDLLAAQIAELQAAQCTCPHCRERASEKARAARIDRFVAIRAMPHDERTAAILALSESDRRALLKDSPADVFIGAPEAWLAFASLAVRDQVVVDSLVIPRHVYVSASSSWSRSHIEISTATADRLCAVGLGSRVERQAASQFGAVVAPGSFRTTDIFHPVQFSPGFRERLTVDQFAALCEIDPVFANGVTTGKIAVHHCTLDEDRGALLAELGACSYTERERFLSRLTRKES